MQKRPKPAKAGAAAGGGGFQQRVPVSPRKPPPSRHPARRTPPPRLIPGGPLVLAPPPQKPVAKKKAVKRRKLAAPGGNCVLDACWALAGCRPDLECEDGLFIPAALEALGTGFAPADPDSDLSRSGLILGLDLPGPHAVLTVPGGWWWSWGELCDPADFPDAVVGEAWEITWPPR